MLNVLILSLGISGVILSLFLLTPMVPSLLVVILMLFSLLVNAQVLFPYPSLAETLLIWFMLVGYVIFLLLVASMPGVAALRLTSRKIGSDHGKAFLEFLFSYHVGGASSQVFVFRIYRFITLLFWTLLTKFGCRNSMVMICRCYQLSLRSWKLFSGNGIGTFFAQFIES